MSRFEQRTMRPIQDFVLVWLENVKTNDNIITQLRHYANDIQTFNDSNECINFITDFSTDQKLILIIKIDDLLNYMTVISTAEPFAQVTHIYIFCTDKVVQEEFKQELHVPSIKIQGIFSQIDSLMNHLHRTIAHQLSYDLVSFQTINLTVNEEKKITVEKLNKQEATFMYAQLVKEVLLEFDLTHKSKMNMIEFCRDLCKDNESELAFINELECNQRNQSAIYFYTAEHFLYRMLNRALRLQEIDRLYHLRYFIRQLHEDLKRLHSEQCQTTDSITVLYRGQGMLREEFEKLQHSVGGLLSFNAFLSTSADFAVAHMYAESILSARDLLSIFIEIDVQGTSFGSNIFADVGHSTHFIEEHEYLFSMGSIFRILSIEQESTGIYHVKLTLTNDQDEELAYLKWFMTTTLHQTYNRGPLFRLAGLMNDMSQYLYSEYFYTLLLNDENIQHQPCALACVHGNMGYLCMGKGNLHDALNHYELALKLYEENSTNDNYQTIATILANIGEIYMTQEKFEKALENYERALTIDMNPTNGKKPNPVYISSRYNQLGVIYERMGLHVKALEYYKRCLQMRLENMPPNHPDLLAPYNNMALLYDKLGQSEEAIDIYLRILEISTASLPPGHLTFATLYHNLASIFEDLDQFNEALVYAQKAFNIVKNSSLSPMHEIYISNRQHLEHLQRIVSHINH